jgi:prepilin-type processing-associated H-X9-DG protein/prepilin-type N-terminal cleavage/methylation domain-containing protein
VSIAAVVFGGLGLVPGFEVMQEMVALFLNRSRAVDRVVRRNRSGLTLMEMILVLAICAVVMAILLPAIQYVRESARRTQCASNLRQFHFDYYRPGEVGRRASGAVSRIEICPSAVKAYGYWRNRLVGFDDAMEAASASVQVCEYAGGRGPSWSEDYWFSEENVRAKRTLKLLENYIATRRHGNAMANYLYFDGHVQVIPRQAVEEWAERGFNFLRAGQGAWDQ